MSQSRHTGSMPPDSDEWAPDPLDPDAIPDKRAFELEIVARLTSMLKRNDSDMGDFAIDLAGSYPDTTVRVSGRGLKSGRPMNWDFELWWMWANGGDDIDGTATLLWSNMDD
jgi:hypothetical protein